MALWETVTFSAQYLEMPQSFLHAHGQDMGECLQALGLDQLDLAQPGVHLSVHQFSQLLHMCEPFCSRFEPLSLQLLRHLPLTAHGLVGMACMTAETMGQALDVSIQYSGLLQSMFHMTRLDGHHHACVTLHHHYTLASELRGLLTEIFVGSVAKMAQFAHGVARPMHPHHPEIAMRVMFSHAGQAQYLEQYRAYFHGDVSFDAPVDQFLVENRILHIPLFTANRILHRQLIQQLDQLLAQQEREQGLVQQIRQWLRQELSMGYRPHAVHVAQRFAMSERTLSRRLSDYQLTVHQLIEQAQLERAQWLLRYSDSSIQTVAEKTGFSDATSFSRAFKRLTQVTPSVWRQEQHELANLS